MPALIKKIAVIGAGVMGAGIAALVANAECDVVLLDIPSDDPANRDAILVEALERIKTSRPPALVHVDNARFIKTGNLEDDLHLLKDCDLIIEAIIEKLPVKHKLYDKIIPHLKEDAIIASNTSTLPLKSLQEKLPAGMKQRLVIMHFFNPPRYMELLELVTLGAAQTDIERLEHFITHRLGKTIVKCNDTPGFIANRIGCFLLESVVRQAITQELDLVIIDKIFTDLFKLPTTGIFGLYDLVGHDVMELISSSLVSNLPKDDDYHNIYVPSPTLKSMRQKGYLGRKSGSGFYRLQKGDKKIKEVINFQDLTYHPAKDIKEKFTSIEQLLNDANDPYSNFISSIMARFYIYLFGLIPEVTDNIHDMDIAMKSGYSWKLGPIELFFNHIPDGEQWLEAQGKKSGLKLEKIKTQVASIRKDYTLKQKNKNTGTILLKNDSAKVVSDDNGLFLIFTTKMNCLNSEIFDTIIKAVDIATDKKQDLYIAPPLPHFSAGADLKYIAYLIEQQDFNLLEDFLKLGQKATLSLKYAPVNIISCAAGVALGGGCEILLHSDYIIAEANLQSGLVEISVGLIPGWGGTKEMFIRSKGDKEELVKNLKNIIYSNKSTSAEHFIRDYNIHNYCIIMNKNFLKEEAIKVKLRKKEVPDINKAILLPLTLPSVNLMPEGDNKLTALQKHLITSFQSIIDKGTITEQELLEFERCTFMELAKNPDTLPQLKKILKL